MGRLFWKIFFWFWMALVLLNLGVGWGVKLYYGQLQESNDRDLEARIQGIARAFEAGEAPEARRLLVRAREATKAPIFVIDEQGEDLLNRPLPGFIREALHEDPEDRHIAYRIDATTPEGSQLRIVAIYRPSWLKSYRTTPIAIVLAIILVISTLVCYWLARYLASPIQRLSNATRQLAGGDLTVRVGEIRRKDEIADLAGDFDLMANKIQALLSSQKQLLQDISHELRSPLARLQVALALAERKNKGDTGGYDRIARDLNRLDELIGEVLTLSRLDTITYHREPVDLTLLIDRIIEDCQLEAHNAGCTIESRCQGNLELNGSPELLRRAIENVLRNAIRFTRLESAVTVDTRRTSAGIVIEISDRGPGIPEANRENMFEAFVRIDPARSHKPGGYGLGLAIAKKAIELHSGHIEARNRSDGGLTIGIFLPC